MKKVEVNLMIRTNPENVIKAFTDPMLLKEWWGVQKSLIDLRVGGVYVISWEISSKGIGYVSSGIIEKFNPQSEIVIRDFVYMNAEKSFLGPMKLIVQVKSINGNSQVYLCQEGYQEGEDWGWYYEAVKKVWPIVMDSFKQYLEK